VGRIDFEAIRRRYPITEFCESRGMQLRGNGSAGRLVSLCPFHDEKTPSFTLYPAGYAHCYGCGWHGDIPQLCADLDGLQRADAARKLCGGDLVTMSRAVADQAKERRMQEAYEFKRWEAFLWRMEATRFLIWLSSPQSRTRERDY